MTLPQNREQAQSAGFLARVWGRIAKPHPAVTEIGAQRQAQLMMGLALVLVLTNSSGILATLPVTGLDAASLVLIILTVSCLFAYVLGRTLLHNWGAILLTVSFVLPDESTNPW